MESRDGMPPLKVKLLTPHALAPMRADEGAAGYDLYADLSGVDEDSLEIPPERREVVPTGIAVALPPGVYGRIAPRSGLAAKHGINVLAGVVDASYRGELKVILHNTGLVWFDVRHGDRIAQLILERIETPDVLVVDALDETPRGSGGFGSTG